jgi:CRISPR system Cascade subunit CasE
MYLSRLILNQRSRRVQRELAEGYEMHRSIMRAFPDGLTEGEERVLWRVDGHPELGLVLLVQSETKPDWSWTSGAGAQSYLAAVPQPSVETKELQLDLAPGQVLAFRLRANPTIKRRFQQSGDHKRVGIHAEEDQLAWLRRKGEKSGFQVLSVRMAKERIAEGVIHRQDTIHRLKLLAVRFDGLLQVSDPLLFMKAVTRGIGSGKGLGFGLLSLAPPPR